MEEMVYELKAKSLAVFNAIRENDSKDLTASDYLELVRDDEAFAEKTPTVTSINGTIQALVNKGLVCRVDAVATVDGKNKIVKIIHLTDEGSVANVTLKVEEPHKKRSKKDADVEVTE